MPSAWHFTAHGQTGAAPAFRSGKVGRAACPFKKTTMLVLAVTLHNIPEGMAVGVAFAGYLSGEGTITLAGAAALAMGIAIQNFPEGAVISLPLRSEGQSRLKAFVCGTLSGIVEPIGAVITIAFAGILTPILPYIYRLPQAPCFMSW